MLTVEGLNVGYGSVKVLFDIQFNVQRGQCLGVLGPNGVGKTTLLRAISGFLQAIGGEIRLDRQPLTGLPPHEVVRRGISQVLQGRQVLGPMSVKDNLLLGGHLTLAEKGRSAVNAGLEEVYTLFPILRERAGMQAGSLSGGEQQMLAIGRALMAQPRVLLLDEPSMGLAPLIVKQILEVLSNIKTQGITMILVEQNPDFAFGLADYCCVLESGRIALQGNTDTLRDHEKMAALYLGSPG